MSNHTHITYLTGPVSKQEINMHVIDTCTQKNHPNFGFLEHHISSIQKRILGWLWEFCRQQRAMLMACMNPRVAIGNKLSIII